MGRKPPIAADGFVLKKGKADTKAAMKKLEDSLARAYLEKNISDFFGLMSMFYKDAELLIAG